MTITACGLKKIYDDRTVVNDINFEVHPGEVVGLLGPNGAGKTTTFYMLAGLVKPNSGRIMLDDTDLTHKPMHEIDSGRKYSACFGIEQKFKQTIPKR
jgi:lipopolysaccharide export system ATP-binding protein